MQERKNIFPKVKERSTFKNKLGYFSLWAIGFVTGLMTPHVIEKWGPFIKGVIELYKGQ